MLQQLAALGMFAFTTDTTLFDKLTRSREWRHERTERFGAIAASQFVGPGAEKITLTGRLVPEVLGRYGALETLVEMADTGDAYPFMDGRGRIFGHFTIDRVDEGQDNMTEEGMARVKDFTIELTRVA
jgi:uncharacterized protein